MFNWIKDKFDDDSKKIKSRSLKVDLSELRPVDDDDIASLKIPINRVISNHNKNKENIIIIDDSPGIVSILEDFIKVIGDNGDINLDEYNVMTFSDKYAPFVLSKTLEELEVDKVKFAIIDIILPGKMKINGKYERLDGVDVAALLYERYGCRNFVFFTGNIISEYIEYIREKIDRFEDVFHRDILDFIIFKGDKGGQITLEKLGELFREENYYIPDIPEVPEK